MEDPFTKSSRGGSKLDALVAQDQQWQNQGNTSLAYKPLSRSEIKRRAEAEAASARALQSPQASVSPSASTPQANNNLKLAVPGNLIRYDSGNPVALGPKGLALLNLAPGQYTLLIYDLQTQKQEVVVMLSDSFELLVQPNNYCSFWDATPTLWAIQFGSAEVQQALIAHIALAKYHYAIATNQNKCIVSNMAPISDTARTLAAGDAVKVSYTLYLVDNTQLCAAPTTDLTAILGQAVESISPDEKLKSLYLGSLKKDLPLFDCLIGGVKNVSRIIVAPAGMAYGNKETVKVPQGSAVVVIATVHKVKPGDGRGDETTGVSDGKEARRKENREKVRGDDDQASSLPTIPTADDNDDDNNDVLTPLKSTGTRTRTDPSTSTPTPTSTSTSASGEPTVVVSDIDSEDEEAQRRRRLASRMGRLSMAQRGATLPTAAPLLPQTAPVRGGAEDADVTTTAPSTNTATTTTAAPAAPVVAGGAEVHEVPSASAAAVPVAEEITTPAPATVATPVTAAPAAAPTTPAAVAAMAAADMPLSPAPSYQHTTNTHMSGVPVHNQTGMGSPAYYSTGSSPNLSTGSAGNYGTGYQFIQQQALLEQLANRVESMYLQLTGGLFKGDAVNGLQFLQIAQKLVQERDGAVGEVEGKDRKIGELMSKVEEMRAKYELVLEETTAKTKARYDSFQQDNQLYQEQVLSLQNDKRELMIKNNENLLKVSELEMQLEMMQQQMDVKARVIAGEKLIEVKMELSSVTEALNEVKAQLAAKVEEVAREREGKEKAEAAHAAALSTLEEVKEETKKKEEEVAAKLAQYASMEARVRELEETVAAKNKALEEQQATVTGLQEQVETKDKLLADAAATVAASVDAEALRAAREEGKQEGVSETLAAAREKIESLTSRSKDRIAQLEAEVAAAQEEVEEVKAAASEKMSKYKEAVLAARAELEQSERVKDAKEKEVQELKIAVAEAKANATQAANSTITSNITTAHITAATAGVGAGEEAVTEEVKTEKTTVKVPVSLPVGAAAVTLLQSVYGETAALLEDFDGDVDSGVALKALKKAVKSVLGESADVKVEGEVDAEVEKVCVVRTVTVKVVEEREREVVVEKVVEKVVEVPVEVVREVLVEKVVEIEVEAKHDTTTDATVDTATTITPIVAPADSDADVDMADDVAEVNLIADAVSDVVTEDAADGVVEAAPVAVTEVPPEATATAASEVAVKADVEAASGDVAVDVAIDAVSEPVAETADVTADAAADVVEKEEDADANVKGKSKGKKGKKGKTSKNTKTPAKSVDKAEKHDIKNAEPVDVAVISAPAPEAVAPIVSAPTSTPTTAASAEDVEDADVEEAPMTVVFHDEETAADATTGDTAAVDVDAVVADSGAEAVEVVAEETTETHAEDKQTEANADVPASPAATTQPSKAISLFADNFGDDDDLFLPTTTPIAQPTPSVSTSNNMGGLGRAGLFDDENEDDVFMAPVMKAQTSNFSGNLFEDNDDLFG